MSNFKSHGSHLSVGSFNVGGFKCRPAKVPKVFELTKNIDILFLQETHFYKISDTLYFNQVFEEKFLIFHSLAPCRNTGTTFLLSRNFSIKNVVKVFEIDGRCLAFKIFIGKF